MPPDAVQKRRALNGWPVEPSSSEEWWIPLLLFRLTQRSMWSSLTVAQLRVRAGIPSPLVMASDLGPVRTDKRSHILVRARPPRIITTPISLEIKKLHSLLVSPRAPRRVGCEAARSEASRRIKLRIRAYVKAHPAFVMALQLVSLPTVRYHFLLALVCRTSGEGRHPEPSIGGALGGTSASCLVVPRSWRRPPLPAGLLPYSLHKVANNGSKNNQNQLA